jgi:GNAT superfamily N-acetyltransferase
VTKVRIASLDDVPAIVSLGRVMHRESPRFSRFPFSAEKVDALVRGMISNPAGAVIFVAEERDQGIVGMFGGIVAEHFFTTKKFATDVAVFVVQAYRGGSAFARMLREFEAWAVDKGVFEIAPGISTEVSPERTLALYEKKGYRLSGHMAVKYV